MTTSGHGVRLEKLIVALSEKYSPPCMEPQCSLLYSVFQRTCFFHKLYENSVFRRGVDEVFVLLGCYAAQLDTWSPTFRHNVLVSFSTVTQASGGLLAPLQVAPIRRLEASVANYQAAQCNNPQQRKSVRNLLTKRSPRFRSTENSEIVIAMAVERYQYRYCHFR